MLKIRNVFDFNYIFSIVHKYTRKNPNYQWILDIPDLIDIQTKKINLSDLKQLS